MINFSLPALARGCEPQPPTGRSFVGGEFSFETMSKSRTLNLGPEAERQLERVAVHESGHETVAEAFGLKAASFVAGRADGVCTHRLGTPHQNAAISWAGALAEDMLGVRAELRTLPTVPLSRGTLPAWFDQMMTTKGKRQLSAADREGIEGYPVQSACDASFNILSERIDALRFSAALLVRESREQVFQSITRGGSGEADRLDVEMHIHQVRQAAIEARQRADAAEFDVKWESMVPRTFPVTTEHFLKRIVSAGQSSTWEHAQRLLDFAEHRRVRHGEQDFLGIQFETVECWLYFVNAYRDWFERRRVAA